MTSRRQLVSALGGRQGDLRVRAATWLVVALFWGSGTVLAEPQPAPSVRQPNERTYLKQDGGSWFEVRRGPAGLEQHPSAAPRAVAPAAPAALFSAEPSGLFEPYTAVATGSWPEAVAIGDVTGDGRNDVALVTSFYFDAANDYMLFVFPQLPDGTLDAPVKYPAAGTYTSSPETVAIGDVNNDGRNDVVVGNAGDAIGVFYQNPSGTLDPVSLHPTADSKCVRIADLNHDGRLDIVGAGWGTDTVTVLLQQAGGTLAAPVVYSAPHAGWDDLEVGDLNGDGWADVAVTSAQGVATVSISVLYQQGDGTLGGLVNRSIAGPEWPSGVAVGDVSGDGRKDLVASYGGNQPSSGLAVFAQDGSGVLAASPTTYASYDIPEPVEVADVNGDGRPDVLVAHGGWNALGVYLQTAGALGSEVLEPVPYASHYNPHGLAVGDIDSDGRPDVVLADYNNGLVILRHARPPTITSFTPTSGGYFASVQLTGTSFSGATDVRFNGTSATFSVVTPTVIATTVPPASTTGPISVTTPGGTATSASSFTVTSIPAPTITSFTPTAGAAGTPVTITGTNFTGVTAVAFAGASAAFTVDSPTQISTTVPAAARSGSITVTGPGGTAVSALFTVPTAFTGGKLAEIAGPSIYLGANFPGSGATGFTTYQGYVYFFASENWDSLHTADRTGLWRTDGTTVEFREPFFDIVEMAVVNGRLLISGTYQLGTPYGRELWSYDGTSPTLVKDVYTGSVSSNPSRFFVVPAGVVAPEERLLFSASPDQNGPTLQVTDGTTGGTAVLDTFKDPREFITFNGSVFLTAKETQASTETNLWSWNPSTGRQLIEPRVDGRLAAVASTLFIAKRSGSTSTGRLKQELWTTNGVQDAATPLSTLWPNGDAAVSELTTVGTTVFFSACDPKVGRGLYKTDGTTVTLVKDFLTPGGGFATGPSSSCDPANGPNQLTEIHGRLFFVVDDGVHGLELWTSDGTTDGTRMVQDLNQDPDPLVPDEFRPAEPSDPSLNLESCGRAKCRVVTSNGFFFTAQTLATGRELWYCDETTMTIALAADPLPGPLSGVTSGYLARLGSRIVFAGSDGYHANSEPWALALGPAALIARSGAAAPPADRAAAPSAAASRPTDGPAGRQVAGAGGPGAVVNAAATLSIEGVVPPVQNPPVCVGVPGAVCVREGSSVSFRVTLTSTTGGHASDVYVDYHTVAVTAKPGTDFVEEASFAPGVHTLTHTPLRFPATTSSTPQTVTVSISTVNDQAFEDHYKSFEVEIFNPTEGTITVPRAEAWIENEDAPGPDGPSWPTVSLNSVTVTESATNPPFAVFQATLNRPSEKTTRLYWTTGVGGEDPPADPALDYRETSGFFVFRPMETAHSVSVETFDDTIDEPNEKFWVDLGTSSNWGAWVGVGRGVGQITDNDNSTLAIADAGSIPEGDAGTTNATFNITISTPYYRDFTLAYTTVDGTAKAGLDYTAVQGTLFFPKGATQRSLTVLVLGDVLDESNEGFSLALSNSTGPSILDTTGAATITDDDTTVSIADASVTEAAGTGTSTLTFTVSTADTNGNKTPFTVDYATADGGAQPATAGADYVATLGTLSFPAATRSRTFTVTVNGDLIDEPAETLLVHLSNSSGPAIFDGDAVGTINDNDTATVTINNISVTEGNSGTTDAVFTISLNTPYYRDFTLNWTTAAGTVNPATEGVDYLAASGTVTFTAGTTTRTVAVPVVADVLDEPNETFAVVLSSSTGPTISDSRGDATITDDDVVTIDVADVSVVEGNSGTTPATFTLTVSGEHTQTITVRVVTSGGGPTPPAATAGTDYTSLPSTVLTFDPGVASQTVSVSVIGDAVAEASNESFGLTLSAPTGGAVLARTKALGIILDDDSNRTISLSPLSVPVAEPLSGSVNATFAVTLSAAAGRTTTVNYATANGSALAGSDYTAASGTLSFDPGDTSKTISVAVLSDALVEGPETFTLALSGATNGTIVAGSATATATISDSLSQIPMGFYTVAPCRAVDTRTLAPGTPLAAGTTRTFTIVGGSCSIPVTARAISFNVTVTAATSNGNVRLFPGGTAPPNTSTVNFIGGVTRANNGIVTLGTDGDVGVLSGPVGTVHVIIDVNGYME